MPRRPAEWGEQARHPDGHQKRADHDKLERKETHTPCLLTAGDVARHSHLRPPVLCLPHNIRRGQRRGSDRPSNGPPGPERRSGTNDEQRRRHRRGHQADLRLSLHAEPHHNAGGQQRRAAAADNRSDREPAERGRAQQVRSGCTNEMCHGERETRDRGAHRRDHLRAGVPAKLSRGQRRERRCRCGRQGRGTSQDEKRPRGQRVHRPRQQRHERRLVGVTERRVRAGNDEVQLVAVISVPRARGEQHRRLRDGDHADPAGQDRPRRSEIYVRSGFHGSADASTGHTPTHGEHLAQSKRHRPTPSDPGRRAARAEQLTQVCRWTPTVRRR